jgi:hypothetical protein
MTSLTVKLLLLFTPGIVCFLIVESLVVHRTRKVHEVFLLSFVYGLLSYAVFAVFGMLFSIGFTPDGRLQTGVPQVSMFRALTNEAVAVDIREVTKVTALAIALSIFISCALNWYWFHDLARFLKITPRFGPPNVWSFVLNNDQIRWATVRDMTNNLMYQGYIRAFSDVDDPAEILLTQVCVFNEATGELLYEADHMYISRNRCDLTVEFPVVSN